ncbi:MAG: tRNA pseudouridine(38-40) synthase TruA [Hyphomicrobiales bacterium]|nr:tRNA pseudouridine(38-40) synthase TruA [Hyphomicrobiales bacterium]PCJ83628.1 MAG: tRNA pseudouridine(38-40) synthase TruA [Hyphomicrobiales bacterium]
MPRYKLFIEYDGTPYCGWQRQPNQLSVQGTIETAIQKFSGKEHLVHGSGRTDAGVHAICQIAHLDLDNDYPCDTVRDALNFHLKPEPTIAILAVECVDDDFDARFSAVQRHYLYRFQSRRPPTVLLNNRVWWVPRSLNADIMHEAAQLLLGNHDFTTFRATQCQAKSPVKTIDAISVVQTDTDELQLTVSARSFLHSQIRSFAGSLKLVGDGKWSPSDLKRSLEAKNRKACGPVAPPHGLYLVQVDYEAV